MSPRSYTTVHDAGPVSAQFHDYDSTRWIDIDVAGHRFTLYPRDEATAAQFRAVAAAVQAINAPPVVALPPTDADGLDVLDAYERAA